MTAMTGSADCPPDRLAVTRDGLHRVAEHVLAAAINYGASPAMTMFPIRTCAWARTTARHLD
jgi:hypothetical protein